ncbi:MAG: phospholipid carrier-dependent glycosyltransferase [Myxococcota bacterium]
MSRAAGAAAVASGLLVALWTRLHNAFTYPADWGFDASFNWQYIAWLSRRWALPAPDAGWSTGDPPLYFALGALLVRAAPDRLILVPLLNVLLGLGIAWLAFALVRRADPDDRPRAWLAAGLVLYLPAHLQMSAMVNEEMLAAALTSAALFALAAPRRRDETDTAGLRRALAVGAASGLAWLAKLTGVLALATAVGTWALDARRGLPLRRAAARVAAAVLVACLLGGWFYARNRIVHGYFQPFGLPAHQQMFEMPPGERGVLDYLRFPLSTFTDPQLLDPDLLRSVWGSTYASVWFDAHRFFLPDDAPGLRPLATLTLLLALLPTLAFGVGLARGLRRSLDGSEIDPPLLLLAGLTLAGYAFYTWQNPWFVVLKGTTLLGLCLPYAWYASETLLGWARRSRGAALGVGAGLLLLAACVTASGTFGGLFERTEVSGLEWRSAAP